MVGRAGGQGYFHRPHRSGDDLRSGCDFLLRCNDRGRAHGPHLMGAFDGVPAATTEPTPGVVTAAHLVYALHSLSILIGVTTAATIVGAFVFGLPSIVAVIVNYVKRRDAWGTY